MPAANSSKVPSFYKATKHHIPKDSNIQSHQSVSFPSNCSGSSKEGGGVRLKTQLSWCCILLPIVTTCFGLARPSSGHKEKIHTIVCTRALCDYQRDLVVIAYCDMT
jgi:hypothetical protein